MKSTYSSHCSSGDKTIRLSGMCSQLIRSSKRNGDGCDDVITHKHVVPIQSMLIQTIPCSLKCLHVYILQCRNQNSSTSDTETLGRVISMHVSSARVTCEQRFNAFGLGGRYCTRQRLFAQTSEGMRELGNLTKSIGGKYHSLLL